MRIVAVEIALVFAAVIVALLVLSPKTVHKYRVPIYVVTALVAAYFTFSHVLGYDISWINRYVRQVFTLGALSNVMFAFVAYTGVLPKRWELTKRLRSVRAEMSVMACILALGHNMLYMDYFVEFFTDPLGMRGYYMYACTASLILIALMIPLFITSFYFVRKQMKARTWKSLQRLSYIFYFALWVHVVGLYLSAALAGTKMGDIYSLVIYTIIWVPYFVSRLAKYLRERGSGGDDDTMEVEPQ